MLTLDDSSVRLPAVPLAIRTVLVGTDGSRANEPAYLAAIWIAVRLGAVVELFSAPSRAELGSTASSLLQRTQSPLLLVGPHAGVARRTGPVVVVVGDHPSDGDLVAVGAAWADGLHRPLIVVVGTSTSPDGSTPPAWGPMDPEVYLTDLAARLAIDDKPATGAAVDPVTTRAGLVPLLERLAPSLVVVGHGNRSEGDQDERHGSVTGNHTAAVVQFAPAPILAVAVDLFR